MKCAMMRLVLLAIWTAACIAVPTLAYFNPVVKPLLKEEVARQELPTAASAMRYDDGRSTPVGASVDSTEGRSLIQQTNRCGCHVCNCGTCRCGQATRAVGFWQRGPIRRGVAAPFRWMFRRRC